MRSDGCCQVLDATFAIRIYQMERIIYNFSGKDTCTGHSGYRVPTWLNYDEASSAGNSWMAVCGLVISLFNLNSVVGAIY